MSVRNNDIVTQSTAKQKWIFRSLPDTIALNTDLSRDACFLHYILTFMINIDTNSGQVTHERLAQLARMSVRSVIRNIAVLEKAGIITVERAPQGSKIPNIYHLAGEDAEVTLRHGVPVPRSSENLDAPQVSPMQPTDADMTESHTNGHELSFQQVWDDETSAALAHETVSTAGESPDPMLVSHPKTPDHVTQRQTLKQESVEMILENDPDVVVVENEDDIPIFKLDGVEPKTMLAWTKQYGVTRVKEVMDALPKQKNVHHAPGWVASALKHGWEFGKARMQKPQKQVYDPVADGRRYITGPYAEFIQY